MEKQTHILLLLAGWVFASLTDEVSATTYNVVPDASSSSAVPGVYGLSEAVELAVAGDIVSLADGTYTDQIQSFVAGEEGNPITIIGGRDAVIKASSPSVRIEHSWITLEGFAVDGEHGDEYSSDSYVNKCVEVVGMGSSEDDALEGFVMKDMSVQYCGGECVRLKNFVINAEVTGNLIQNCGLYDFEFEGDDKNGEGIYIGTSFTQWADYGEDRSNGNWVSDNKIATYGNECVEVKEGSSYNIIEYNVCSAQRDEKSGCFCSRGDENIIRYNDASDCYGAGVRLGGWTDDDGHEHGQNNDVYGNHFADADYGALNVQVVPQGLICGNTCEGEPCDISGDNVDDIEQTWDASCMESTGTPSPVIVTPSPVLETPSPNTGTPSPTLNHLVPVGDTPSPTLNTPAPVVTTPSPVLETPSPVTETPSPTLPTPSPVIETPPPTVKRLPPIGDTPSPTIETPPPTIRRLPPIGDTPSPTTETPSPVLITSSPVTITPPPTIRFLSSDSVTPSPTLSTISNVASTPSPVVDDVSKSTKAPSPVDGTPSPTDDGNDDYESDDDGDDDDDDDDDADDDDGGGDDDYESDEDADGDHESDDGADDDDNNSDDDDDDDDGDDDDDDDDGFEDDDDGDGDNDDDVGDDDGDNVDSDDDDGGHDNSGDDNEDDGDDANGDDDDDHDDSPPNSRGGGRRGGGD